MQRREFIALLGGGIAALPFGAGAQQPATPVIGFLSASAAEAARLTAVQRGLAEHGFTEGRNVAIEFRYAEGRYERLAAMAAEFVSRPVTVILANALPAALAAKQATATIPIIFVSGADPVQLGLVESLHRPGPNITGISNYFGALGGKRLEVLRELVPGAGLIGYLLNPNNQNAQAHSREVQAAARSMGQRIDVLEARTVPEIEIAFTTLTQRKAGALLVGDDPFYSAQSAAIVALASRHGIPAIHYTRSFVEAGGLISYGSSLSETYRLAGIYTARVLKGEKPADLPVVQPTKFELIINLKAAKALGLAMPPTLIARADEVFE